MTPPGTTPSLRITEAGLHAMRAHGVETYPHECCGVMLGVSVDGVNYVQEVRPAGNTRTDSAHNRYNIAPQELVRMQREGRARGLDIVGFYHSHPDHPAMWSVTDIAEAHWIGCSYVITSVVKGAATETNSFLLTGSGEEDKAFAHQALELTAPQVVADTLLACRP